MPRSVCLHTVPSMRRARKLAHPPAPRYAGLWRAPRLFAQQVDEFSQTQIRLIANRDHMRQWQRSLAHGDVRGKHPRLRQDCRAITRARAAMRKRPECRAIEIIDHAVAIWVPPAPYRPVRYADRLLTRATIVMRLAEPGGITDDPARAHRRQARIVSGTSVAGIARKIASGASGRSAILATQGRPANCSRFGFTTHMPPENPARRASPIATAASAPPMNAMWRGFSKRSKFARLAGVMAFRPPEAAIWIG